MYHRSVTLVQYCQHPAYEIRLGENLHSLCFLYGFFPISVTIGFDFHLALEKFYIRVPAVLLLSSTPPSTPPALPLHNRRPSRAPRGASRAIRPRPRSTGNRRPRYLPLFPMDARCFPLRASSQWGRSAVSL